MNGVSVAPVGSNDWEEIGHLEPLTFTMTDVDPDTTALLYGQHVGMAIPEEPAFAVYMKTVHEVSGEPEKPQPVRGLLAWLRGTNRKNQDQYVRELMRWIAAGKPTKQVEVGTYIPKARIIPNPA